jgi:hypothetical protein
MNFVKHGTNAGVNTYKSEGVWLPSCSGSWELLAAT